MFQATTVLVEHLPRDVNGRNGTFTVHKFKDQSGIYFETTKQALADLAYGFMQRAEPVTVTYEEVPNGEWINNKIQGLVAAGAGAPVTTAAAPAASSGAPAPSRAPAAAQAPQQQARGSQDEFRRSKDEMRRSEALASALKLVELKLVEGAKTSADIFKLADFVGKYLEVGTQSAPEPTAAPEAAPAPPAPVPDDDIPF